MMTTKEKIIKFEKYLYKKLTNFKDKKNIMWYFYFEFQKELEGVERFEKWKRRMLK